LDEKAYGMTDQARFAVPTSRQRAYIAALLTALLLAQINQPYPDVAIFHHLPTMLLVVASPVLLRRWPLSDTAVGCLVAFLLIHTLGGRYTYVDVPYDAWAAALTVTSLSDAFGWSRNHYDRFAHLAYGALVMLPVAELAQRSGRGARGTLWAALAFVGATSALYEVFEWLLTFTVPPHLADQYNGQQGDMWDAQKDMALAGLGALAAWWPVMRRLRITV
jgi:putative membrane protein